MKIIFVLLALAWSPAILQGFNWIDTDAMIYTILGFLLIQLDERSGYLTIVEYWLALLTGLCVLTKQNIALGMAVGIVSYYLIHKQWIKTFKFICMLSIFAILSTSFFMYFLDTSYIYWVFDRAKERIGNPIHIEIVKQFWRTDNNMLKVILLMNLLLMFRYPILIYGLYVLVFAGLGRCGIDFMTHSILAVYVPLYLWSKEH